MNAPIDVQLREYTEYFDGLLIETAADDVLVERVSAGPVRPLQPRERRLRRPLLVTLAAVVATAVLIGGIVVALQSERSEAPVATTVAPTVTTAAEPPPPDQPETLRGTGTLQTPLGDVTWSHIGGAQGELPGAFFPFATPTGFAAFDPTDSADPSGYWTSADGVSWTRSDLPVPVESAHIGVEQIGDAFWLTTWEPFTLWRSNDFESWQQIDLAALQPPASTGLDWSFGISSLRSTGESVVFEWFASPQIPLNDLFASVPDDVELGLWPSLEDPGAFDVFGDEMVGTVRIVAFESRGAVLDAASGEVLHEFTLDIAEPIVDENGLLTGIALTQVVIVDEGGSMTTAPAPWPIRSGHRSELVEVAGQLFAFVGYSFADNRNGMDVWSTRDGMTWEELGAPTFLPEGSDGAVFVFDRNGRLYADVFPPHEGVRWVSDDGVTWSRFVTTPPPGLGDTSVLPFGDGYVAWSEDGPRLYLWFSMDGTTWDQIDVTDLNLPRFDAENFEGGYGAAVIGASLFIVSRDDGPDGQHQMWILEMEP